MPYYAVRKGRNPGVFKDWSSCQAQVKQFPNAAFKKFVTEKEAWDFVNNTSTNAESVTAEATVPAGKKQSYSAFPQQLSEAFNSAAAADQGKKQSYSAFPQQLSEAFNSAAAADQGNNLDQSTVFKSIEMLQATAKALRATAEQLIKGTESLNTQIEHLAGILQFRGSGPVGMGTKRGHRARYRLKRSCSDFTALSEPNSARGPKRLKTAPHEFIDCGFTGTPFTDDKGTTVYTDGSSFNNGCAIARAGIGIFWGHNDPNNMSERLVGRQTNNRAEIHAAEVAVEQAKKRGIQNLILHTDSQFLINGITTWIHKWKSNGWKLSTGGDVINREDFEKLDQAIKGLNIKWMHVRGHRGVEGNVAADKLANEGAKKNLV